MPAARKGTTGDCTDRPASILCVGSSGESGPWLLTGYSHFIHRLINGAMGRLMGDSSQGSPKPGVESAGSGPLRPISLTDADPVSTALSI